VAEVLVVLVPPVVLEVEAVCEAAWLLRRLWRYWKMP
jgi:hypothetical protein